MVASKQLGAQISALLAYGGLIVGVLSAISAIVRILDVGLVRFLGELIGYYQGLFTPVHTLLARLPFRISPAAVDLVIVYLTLVGVSHRAVTLVEKPARDFLDSDTRVLSNDPVGKMFKTARPNQGPHASLIRNARIFLLFPILTMLPIRHYLQVRKLTRKREEDEVLYMPALRSAALFVAFPAAVLTFFVLNGLGSS